MILLTVNWPHVWMVTLIGFGLTFILLILLVYLMRFFGMIMKPRVKVPKVVHGEEKSEIRYDEKVKVTLPGQHHSGYCHGAAPVLRRTARRRAACYHHQKDRPPLLAVEFENLWYQQSCKITQQ